MEAALQLEEAEEAEDEERGKSVKVTVKEITSITPVLQDILDLFSDIISFQYVLHFDVSRSQIEWNLKVKIQILVFTGEMLNNHGNPYIESTTVLSRVYICSCWMSLNECISIQVGSALKKP